MWKGYEPALVAYCNAMLVEWARRGKKNDLLKPYQNDKERNLVQEKDYEMPPWWGNEELHDYHKHALVAKLPEHYKKIFPDCDGSLYNGSYPWPRRVEGGAWVLRWPKSRKIPDKVICEGGESGLKRKTQDTTTGNVRKSKRLRRKTE